MKKSNIHSAEELALPQAQNPEKEKTEKYVIIVWVAIILLRLLLRKQRLSKKCTSHVGFYKDPVNEPYQILF